MLQIIGWLGCWYLAAKALEFALSREYRNDEGNQRDAAAWAAVFCVIGALGFAFALASQGEAMSEIGSRY